MYVYIARAVLLVSHENWEGMFSPLTIIQDDPSFFVVVLGLR